MTNGSSNGPSCPRRSAIEVEVEAEAEAEVNPVRVEVYSIMIKPLGLAFDAPDDRPVWQSAREAAVAMPSACRNGTCRACLCRLVRGSVVYRIEWPGLSADEKAEGYVLPCVAHPASALVIDAPRAVLLASPP